MLNFIKNQKLQIKTKNLKYRKKQTIDKRIKELLDNLTKEEKESIGIIKKSEPKVEEPKIDIDVFKSKEFLTEAIDLYYRDKGQKLTNLSKFSMIKLKQIIAKRNIPFPELIKFYNKAIDNMFNMYSDSNSDKIKSFERNGNNFT